MPQVSPTPGGARESLQRALEGACYSSDQADDLIEAFRSEVLLLASFALGHLGYPKASALLADTADVVGYSASQGGAR